MHIAAIAQEKRGHVCFQSVPCTVWLVVKRNAAFERGQLDTCEMPEENPNFWNVGRAMLDNVESQERSLTAGPILILKIKSTFLDANSNLISLDSVWATLCQPRNTSKVSA